MNLFTDPHPTFAYQSTEASQTLGIPDSAEIHLAITSLASQLLRLLDAAELQPWEKRVVALRTASGAALFGWSRARAEWEALDRARVGGTPDQPPGEEAGPRRNWLEEAAQQLQAEGHPVPPDYGSQRSPYGWRYLSRGDKP